MSNLLDMLRQQGVTVMTGPTGDPMFDRQGEDVNRRLVSPYAQQQFPNGTLGPLNILPQPQPMTRR